MPEPPDRSYRMYDSPLFWACLFGTAALLGMVAIAGKYGRRQLQVELQGEARQYAPPFGERRGELPADPEQLQYSDENHLAHALSPLIWIVAAVLLVAWVWLVVEQHKRRKSAPD